MVGRVATCSSSLSMIRISVGDSDSVLRHEGGDRGRPDFVSGVGDLLAVQDREAVDLLDDVAHVDRGRRRAALDDLAARARRSSGVISVSSRLRHTGSSRARRSIGASLACCPPSALRSAIARRTRRSSSLPGAGASRAASRSPAIALRRSPACASMQRSRARASESPSGP